MNLNLPLDTIGIDMGHSLTKIVYIENDELHLLLLATQNNIKELEKFLESKKTPNKKFNFTGGKAFNLYNKFSKKVETHLFNEFQAIKNGFEILFVLNKKKDMPDTLIITIGTGTSIVLKKKNTFEHLGGSAMGGGFFLGLIKLLFEMDDFQEAVKTAKKGNRFNIDLKVSDIYDDKDDRIENIFREFTAASLGKINVNTNLNSLQQEDIINSLINIIGENIGILACHIAENNDITHLTFCGGFLINNRILKRILSIICKVRNKESIFLKNSEFIGAIGALIGENQSIVGQ